MRALMLILVFGLAAEARACIVSLATVITRDPVNAMEWADAVFYATVRNWDQTDRWTASAVIDIHESWKGSPSSMLYNNLSSTCSVHLEAGRSYLIYAKLRTDGLLEVEGAVVADSRAADAIKKLREHAR